MPRLGRLAALAALALTAAGCTTTQSAKAPGPREEGRAFVARACAGCHAIGPTGASPNPDAPAFRDLARSRSNGQLLQAIEGVSRNGHVEMPPIYVTPDEMQQVVAFLKSLRGPGA